MDFQINKNKCHSSKNVNKIKDLRYMNKWFSFFGEKKRTNIFVMWTVPQFNMPYCMTDGYFQRQTNNKFWESSFACCVWDRKERKKETKQKKYEWRESCEETIS